MKLLLIVDPQVDFVDGSLAVSGATEAMNCLADYVSEHGADYATVAITTDWHPANHCSFRQQDGPWPVHCVMYTPGAAIYQPVDKALKSLENQAVILRKGNWVEREEYSVMQNAESADKLRRIISDQGITHVDVCGIAGDVCVHDTLVDLLQAFPQIHFSVLQKYVASLDGGAKLQAWVHEHGIELQ